jgi:hypothetical protein
MTLATNLSQVTMTPANNLLWVSNTTGDKTVGRLSAAYTLKGAFRKKNIQ